MGKRNTSERRTHIDLVYGESKRDIFGENKIQKNLKFHRISLYIKITETKG